MQIENCKFLKGYEAGILRPFISIELLLALRLRGAEFLRLGGFARRCRPFSPTRLEAGPLRAGPSSRTWRTARPRPRVYGYRHATTNDFFIAGNSGAGNLNPRALTVRPDSGLPSGLEAWPGHCRLEAVELYAFFGLVRLGADWARPNREGQGRAGQGSRWTLSRAKGASAGPGVRS